MSRNMLKFVKIGQQNPPKRAILNRKEDFNEIYKDFIQEKAEEQSSRCSQCGVPFCQVHCPLSNNIPDWLKLTAEGRLQEAYELAQSTNNMPEVCGRICPQDRLCEGNCVIEQSGHGSVTIGSIEKHITDDRTRKGRDYYSALNPDEFISFVRLIRSLPSIIGREKKWNLSEAELQYRKFSFR